MFLYDSEQQSRSIGVNSVIIIITILYKVIRLFRKIRQNLLSESNYGQYILYASGEITLVIVGILLALQIDNWNENRKQTIQKNLMIQSLYNDLKMDSVLNEQTLKILQQDTATVMSFIRRMSGSNANIDTLIQIARFEFDPRINVTVTFNNNTLKGLLATGTLNLLDKWMQDEILQLSVMHEDYISRTELNLGAYVNQVIAYARRYPLGDFGNIYPDSKIADAIWQKAKFEELGTFLNAVLAIRNVTDMYAIDQLKSIQDKTIEAMKLMTK